MWEDNDSIENTPTNDVLMNLFGFSVGGNDRGKQIIRQFESDPFLIGKGSKILTKARTCEGPGTFNQNNPIFSNMDQLFEGDTISFPKSEEEISSHVKILARSSHGKPVILYSEQRSSTKGPNAISFGRVIIDCGFTKLFPGLWATTKGTSTYVCNATAWLTGMACDAS